MEKQSKRVLYVAYHYPPILGSSGVHRTLAFTRELANNGWDVTVLTTTLKAYENWSESQLRFIPENIRVIRAFARNVAKHFSFRGKYLGAMALPDNWQSWILGGVLSGIKHIITHGKPQLIVSTYPIASAHIIAYCLSRMFNIPWIVDLRDPMAQANYPTEPSRKKWFLWIEQKFIKHSHAAIVTTPGAKTFYEGKYPHTPKDFWHVVPNGYDEVIFNELSDKIEQQRHKASSQKIVLLHSGLIYPNERDPSALFDAIQQLKEKGQLHADNFLLRLRASGNEALFQQWVEKRDIQDLVEFAATIPYTDALNEMTEVDGLLIMQAANCDYQIPAKAYEYIRCKKPVLALTTETGDTGRLLRDTGHATIAPLDDTKKIEAALQAHIENCQKGLPQALSTEKIRAYSRQYHAEEFVQVVEAARKKP